MRTLRCIVFILAACFMSSQATAKISAKKVNALIFYSYHIEGKGSQKFDEGIRFALKKDASISVKTYTEYMDAMRFMADGYEHGLFEHYLEKYKHIKIDIIIAYASPALDFLLKYGEKIFPGTPVVFGLVSEKILKERSFPDHYTGILSGPQFSSTLDTALTVLPETKKVLIVGGTSPVDKQYFFIAKAQLKSFHNRVDIQYVNQYGMEDILQQVASQPENTIIIYSILQRDGKGTRFSPRNAAYRIAKAANVPVFGLSQTHMGTGIVGGSLTSTAMIGGECAKTAMEILKGKKQRGFTALHGDTHAYMFDWRQLKRWSINEKHLPAGSVVLYKKLTVWNQYYKQIIVAVIFMIFETLLIALLLINKSRRIRTEQLLSESEKKYKELFDHAQEGIWVIDSENNTTLVNPSMAEMLGYAPSDMIGKPLFNFMDEQGKKIAEENIKKRKNGLSEQHDFEFIRKNGERIYTTLETSPILDENGTYMGAIAGIINITERKIAEQKLKAGNKRFYSLFNESPVPIWEEDFSDLYTHFEALRKRNIINFREYFNENPDEVAACAAKIKILDVNKAALTLHGAKNKNELMENWDKIFSEKSLDVFKEEIIALANGESEFTAEAEVKTLSGELRYVFLTLLINKKTDDQIIGLLTTTDISEQKKGAEDRKILRRQLIQAQKMESIGKLAGGIAHDFNNILFPIMGFSQMSMDELPKDHSVQNYLQDVLNAAKRARDLVRRILLFSRQKEITLKPSLITPVIKETIKLLRSSIPVNIDIQTQFYDGEDYILCDETQMHEIVMNLCTNAYHSLEEKGDRINIRLDKKPPPSALNLPPGEYLCLSVSDNGSGIRPEIKEKIFEPYFTTKKVGKGSGLGLSVVHGIIKSYHGDISVESSLGDGSAFNVFLPVTSKSNESQPEKEQPKYSGGNEKILFVDDEKAIVKLGTKVLEKVGYDVTGAYDGLNALALFKSNPDKYDLIITDMAMPGMIGSDLAKKILDIRADIPIIICSGYSEKLDAQKAKNINIKGFIDKPILLKDLTTTVRQVLDQN